MNKQSKGNHCATIDTHYWECYLQLATKMLTRRENPVRLKIWIFDSQICGNWCTI